MATTTQRRITLLRHAKAAAEGTVSDDHARPLAPRGRDDAMALGAWLKENHALPTLILCSSAVRTRETLAALGVNIATLIEPKAYLASANELLALLQETDDAVPHVMLIAHNPGIHGLAALLVGDAVREADMDALASKFPTCAYVSMTVTATSWRSVAVKSATLDALRYPHGND